MGCSSMVEHLPYKREVGGSSPPGPTRLPEIFEMEKDLSLEIAENTLFYSFERVTVVAFLESKGLVYSRYCEVVIKMGNIVADDINGERVFILDKLYEEACRKIDVVY